MKYIVIRNLKSDKLTLHSTKCSVAVKFYAKVKDLDALAYDSHQEAIDDMEFHGGKVKICDCAKV